MKRLAVLTAVVLLVAGIANAGIINGTFDTGDLTGWTLFDTATGTSGSAAPGVSSFNTTGSGASNAAAFQVGITSGNPGSSFQGGGIYQSLTLAAGTVSLSLDFAVFNPHDGNSSNITGGRFRLLLDGSEIASQTIDTINDLQTIRGSLSGAQAVSAGLHEVRIEIARNYYQNDPTSAPRQYIDNVVASQDANGVPEPATWLMIVGGAGLMAILRTRR